MKDFMRNMIQSQMEILLPEIERLGGPSQVVVFCVSDQEESPTLKVIRNALKVPKGAGCTSVIPKEAGSLIMEAFNIDEEHLNGFKKDPCMWCIMVWETEDGFPKIQVDMMLSTSEDRTLN